jgi:dolichol-phosphate mannosyltransferase
VYQEEDCLLEFHERLTGALAQISGVRTEIVYVNDGSRDSCPELLRKLCSEDRSVRLVDLSRNFGHQLAITAGIDHAAGDAVVVIDTDLQDPPEVIVELVERWREGWKVVHAVRTQRQGESRFKVATAKAFYRLINWLSDVPMVRDAGDFRLLDRQVVDELKRLRERNRYVRGLVAWVGFPQGCVEYQRDPRFSGSSKYQLKHMVSLATDAVTSFSEKPLRLAIQAGLIATTASLALAAWLVASKLLFPESALPGFASLMVAVLFFGGVQLLSTGLLGEYVGRIYRESKGRPLYVVGDLVNYASDSPTSGSTLELDDAFDGTETEVILDPPVRSREE